MAEKRHARQLILEAVITCIEKYGLENVTTRKIAIAAGTNVAAINYYFRSKDDLIAETLSMTINHMLEDVFAAMDVPGESFETTLTNVLFYLLEGQLRFPGTTRAHLNQAISRRDSVSARAMTRVFQRLADRAALAFPRLERQNLQLRVSQIMASILFMMMAPGFFRAPRAHRLTSGDRARQLAASYTSLFMDGIDT